VQFSANGIALSTDGRTLYSVPTAVLDDPMLVPRSLAA